MLPKHPGDSLLCTHQSLILGFRYRVTVLADCIDPQRDGVLGGTMRPAPGQFGHLGHIGLVFVAPPRMYPSGMQLPRSVHEFSS